MSSFVRSSKFRHVFCDAPRPDAIFSNLRLSTVTGDQNYIKANSLYFAAGLQGGGGPFGIFNLNKPGRFDAEDAEHLIVGGHSQPVLDFDFSPFDDQIVASCSEDQSVKVWVIPTGPLNGTLSDAAQDLRGHQRKVTFLKFHPTASNVLGSASGDQTVKLWDIEKGSEINSQNDAHKDLIQDLVWDYTGAQYATSCKDKNVRLFDARSATVTDTIVTAHEGAKSTKLSFLGSLGKLVSVGFTRQSQRQFKIWDQRNTSTPLKSIDVDQAAGTIMPFFDADTNILYLAGKGDGNVRYYEVANEAPFCFPLADHRSQTPAKGMAMVPKRGLNVMGCETARMLKLTSSTVEPLCFFVPRKSDAFQEDLYPPTNSVQAAHSADEWLAGSDLPPVLISLDPRKGFKGPSSVPSAPAGGGAAPVAKAAPKTAAVLQGELDAALARIAELEARVAELEVAATPATETADA